MKRTAIAAALSVLLTGAAQAQFVSQKALTIEAAQKMTAACTAFAAKNGWHLSVWVIDGSGTPLAFQRMEGAGALATDTALQKAKTALKLGHPSGDLGQGLAQGHLDILGLGLFAMAGGLPIAADGKVVAAIGAGGAQSNQDEQCAQAGVDAVLGKTSR